MHRGHRLAQPVRLRGEVPADLVRPQVALAHQVPHARGGHRPTLRAVREELGQQAQGGLLAVDRPDQFAEGLRDVRRTHRVQRAVDLRVRVRTRLQPAKHLENGRMPVDDRGVGLLRPDHQPLGGGVDGRVRLPPGRRCASPKTRFWSIASSSRRETLTSDSASYAVRPVDGTDGRVRDPVGHLPGPADPDLVPLQAGGGADGQQHLLDVGFVVILRNRGAADDGDVTEFLTLRREPALVRQVLGQQGDEVVIGGANGIHAHIPSGLPVMSNQ